MQRGDELLVSFKRAKGAAFLVILLARGNATINGAPLLWCLLIIRGRKFGKNGDDSAANLDFKFLAALKPGPPAHCTGDHERRFVVVFDSDGHSSGYACQRWELSSSQ